MDSTLVGLIGVILVVVIAEAVGVCLRRPIAILLRSEKGTERSDFWNAYLRVGLLLVPAFFALVSFPTDSLLNPVVGFVGTLRWGLAGLLIALVVAGKVLRVPSPPSYRTAPYVPPTIPPASSGTAR